MFGIIVLIGLSRLIHTHIACEIDTAKITAAIFRISYRLHDLIRLNFNSLPCSNNKMCDDVVFPDRFRYQLTMFGIAVMIGLSRLLPAHIAYEIDIEKIAAALF